jgi:alkanesulfonate monooxygenase SsuD/methylene tetrahydromethanopterin reductase-like flavin-dependent oxidoreductase (luciferase family)
MIWTNEIVEFHGDFYDIPKSRVDPKPIQRPYPPILLGGATRASLQRAGRLADGWISSIDEDLRHIDDSIDVVRSSAQLHLRDPIDLRFVVRGHVAIAAAGAADRRPLCGSIAEVRGDLDRLSDQGVTEFFLDLNYDELVVSPNVKAAQAAEHARHMLELLAPR